MHWRCFGVLVFLLLKVNGTDGWVARSDGLYGKQILFMIPGVCLWGVIWLYERSHVVASAWKGSVLLHCTSFAYLTLISIYFIERGAKGGGSKDNPV